MTPGRPWWKRRWGCLPVGLLWLAVAYPLSVGPVAYAVGRGWLPPGTGGRAFGPLRTAVNGSRLAGAWQEYRVECHHAGLRHRAPTSAP